MQGYSLRFYMHENQKHRGRLLYQWLLEQARDNGFVGGTAFRAIAGFGRNGVLNEQQFFECAGQETVLVEFLVSDEQARRLTDIALKDGAPLFYARFPVEFGVLGRDDTEMNAAKS